ncbi:hypothetical protein FA95DRAFT_1567016 [Auriscalpium vulgare]|uniref:Uncharacterized protein n=1 Tax=Auriscalpium vulgare TaxID=40419 RepID=A0ACB8R7E0_9AGAM|nr:hypothetical protein FA95DRAFT_1567016 [Auriscalpium vulgare]
MDPSSSYFNKKIVDLTDAELIALGFHGENALPAIKRLVDRIRAHSDRTFTCFMIDCVRGDHQVNARPQDATKPPASPTTPSSPALSEAETLHIARSSSTTPTPGQSSPAQSSPQT